MKGQGRTRQELLAEIAELRARLEQELVMRDLTARQQDVEAIGAGEERLKLALKAAKAGTWDYNLLTKEVYWSEEYYSLANPPPELSQPSYENWLESVRADDREAAQQALTQALEQGEVNIEYRPRRADGRICWLKSRGQTVYDAAGQPVRVIGIIMDITEQKLAEEALRESERRFRLMAESIQDAFWIAPPDLSKIIYVSPGYELIWGRTCRELYRKPYSFLEAIHPDDQERVKSEIAATQAQNVPWSHEYRIIKPDGAVRWIQDRGFPVRDDQGSGILFIGVSADITERKEAEEALKASESRFKAIFEGAAIGIGLLDLEGRILKVNPAAQELLGYKAQELVGKHLAEIMDPDDNSTTLALLKQVGAGKLDRYRLANRFSTKDASPLWLDFSVSLTRGVNGEPLFAIAMGQDITARKEAEERVSRYYRRLQGLSAQLEEVQETERQLLARELHDRVGQNLGVLGINLNLVQSLVDEGDKDQIRARLDDSMALLEQTVALIRDLMADLRPAELDDYGLLEALRSHCAKFSQRTNITVDVGGEELAVRLEPSVEISLFRIVQEALTNVAKHAQATRVRVIEEVNDDKVRLTIADNGAGFDLTRLETTKGRQGWGLITMTERAVAAGGHCRIESQPGKGTRVIVEVPR